MGVLYLSSCSGDLDARDLLDLLSSRLCRDLSRARFLMSFLFLDLEMCRRSLLESDLLLLLDLDLLLDFDLVLLLDLDLLWDLDLLLLFDLPLDLDLLLVL